MAQYLPSLIHRRDSKTQNRPRGKSSLLGIKDRSLSVNGLTRQKSPEDLIVLRVDEAEGRLAASAVVVTAIVIPPTALAMGRTAMVAVAVTWRAARGDIHHRPVRCRNVNHRRRAMWRRRWAVNNRRRTTGARDHYSRRERDRQPESEVQRPTRLRRGGEPSECNCGNQTEEMLCLHDRFDEVFMRFFKRLIELQIIGFESVKENELENE